MTSIEKVERYVNLFRLRLKMLASSRGFAAMAIAALFITVVSVTLAIRLGFPSDVVTTARLLLVATLIGLGVYFIVLPSRRIESGGAEAIEQRAPEFDGRITTYLGMRDPDNPLRELLAEDALRIAAQHEPETAIPQKEFSWALGAASAALVALLALAIAGPGNYAYGVRHLWVGWAFPGVLPPQTIVVEPGNDGIRAGGNVTVRATTKGFSPRDASVHARFGDDEWQQVSMAALDGSFEFTFFSVREPLEYYVSAANVRSETFEIKVVDLPSIDRFITTYRFPEWTGREPEVRDPGGDVRTIADTRVEVEIRSPEALPEAVLVVDDREIPLAVDGGRGAGEFSVREDGQYFVAALVGNERIRLTDDYFISVLDDAPPEIEFDRPGRDWSASAIEEVTVRVSARDDFLLESLEIRYSINGSDWQSAELSANAEAVETNHLFFLESLTNPQNGEALAPGDLISYYAVAGDREQTASTDIFFVDVQPFDKRYSQSQMSGGGGGQQGGGPGDEISERQREIIVSTWNLIRETKEQKRSDTAYVPNNAQLLSRLQNTLKEQAETLAARTRARQLTASDEKIAEFVENLDRAAAAMVPASARLADVDLEEAILPEQEALQHLLRAEAVFTDISVSMQANNRGGGGGRAGRDLTDMFELEMDLEKNQYETGSQATPESEETQLNEIGNELEELARRQEQLANRLNREQATTPAERWQQDLLRREVEELRDRLERMQQAANSQQDPQNGSQQSGAEQSSSSSEPSSSSSESTSQNTSSSDAERRSEQLRRRLDSAVRAMNDAEAAMRQGADREELQRAAAEAQRQLEGARDQAAADRDNLRQASLANLGERGDDLYDRQTDIEQRLQDAIRSALEESGSDDRLSSGMSFEEEYAMAREKRELQADLQTLEQDAKRAARSLSDTEPESAARLEDALEELREDEVDARLAVSAAYIEQGEAVYVSASESAITESLERFVEGLDDARQLAEQSQASDAQGQEPGLARTLAQTQALRRQLQALSGGADQRGPVTNRGRDDLQQSTGVRVPDLEVTDRLQRDFDDVSDDVLNLFRDLRSDGVSEQGIDELRRLAAEVRASEFSGNEALLARESQLALNLVEQLELALARAAEAERGSPRASTVDEIPDQHRAPVANYYRTLGEDGRADDQAQ